MKYIMIRTKDGTREFPIIFPNHLTHSEVADGVIAVCSELQGGKAVSAGEFSSLDLAPQCTGHSSTLQLNSRKSDSEVIPMTDYNHGLL